MERQDHLANLRTTFAQFHPLTDEEWAALSKIWLPFTAGRKEMLTETGSVEKYLYFVINGVQRVFYADELGREATLVFSYAHNLGGVVDSLMRQSPSAYCYETLTPSTFLRASFLDLNVLMNEWPAIQKMMTNGLAISLSGVLHRLVETQCFSSEQKFKALLKRSPHILQLVPHKYLANYLGIDPTNFSKLINSIII